MPPVPGAGTGLSPLDDELELLPGTLSPWLQASLVRLGSWMPFAHAARELGWFSRAPGEGAGERVGGRTADRDGRGGVRSRADGGAGSESHPLRRRVVGREGQR